MAETFTITDQQQRTRLGAGGRFQDVMEVSFTTVPHGYAGTVDVPLSQYGPDAVRAAIEARVKQLHDVHDL